MSEIKILESVQGCDNIVKIVDRQENKKLNGFEVYLLLEFCPHGTLFDLIE
jgi:serine/threonine protein kinase